MISVIGGTYREINYDEERVEIFGSGLRCCKYLLENNEKVNFHTSGNDEVKKHLLRYSKVYSNLNYQCIPSGHFITFKYYFALDEPLIFPSIPFIPKTNTIEHSDDNIICYGMLESDCKLRGKLVVYDPQTSIKPATFRSFGEADQLIYIVNWNEAKSITSSEDIEVIKQYFFETEKVYAFIIKNGPFGATLFYENEKFEIPSYKTDTVNKIGSGDIFTASFGFFWMSKNYSVNDCANYASKSTAIYCNDNIYNSKYLANSFPFKPFEKVILKEKQIYLASPIFSLSNLILIDKIRTAFLDFGVKVFSPFHNVGFGSSQEIASLDLEGLRGSDIIFCVLDNLDSGTLIEAGYSMAQDKKIIGYHRTCTEEELLMLTPGNVSIYKNLTTAIYQTIWSL
jgi:hypothetical protein